MMIKATEIGTSGVLAGKTIVFVACGNDPNKVDLYERFRSEYGLRLILLESEDNVLAKRLHTQGVLHHLPIDLTASPQLLEDCVETIKNGLHAIDPDHTEPFSRLNGVLTFWDDAVALTARIATTLGFTTSPPAAIDIAHDKYATRRCLKEKGLPYPKCATINRHQNPVEVVRSAGISFPLVIKPVQGATSIGVYFCDTEEELTIKLSEGFDVLKRTYADNELMGLVFDDSPSACTKNTYDLLSFVVEEFIDGPEVDIDMIVSNGEVVYSQVSDDWDYEEPWRTELGVNYPSRLPQPTHEDFREAAAATVKAFGISHGVLHVEMKYSSKHGPMLIEINPRVGGGPCHFFHKELYGVDLALEQALIAVGQGSNPIAEEPTHWGVGLLLYAAETGTLALDCTDTKEYQECINAEYVVKLSIPCKKDDHLLGWNGSAFPSHAGLLMVKVPMTEMNIEQACSYVSNLRENALASIKYI